MKKIATILFLFVLVGCKNDMAAPKQEYLDMINNLESAALYTEDIPCNIDIFIEELGEEYSYRVIIDDPDIVMNNIKALVIHDVNTNDIYPSIGIFDGSVNMVPDVVNNDHVKGIILSGYIDVIGEIKVIIIYTDEFGNEKTIYYKG